MFYLFASMQIIKSVTRMTVTANGVRALSSGNQDFFEALQAYPSARSPQRKGFSWVTQDQELQRLLQEHFPSARDTFFIQESQNTDVTPRVVDVVPIQSTCFNTQRHLEQKPHASISVGGPSALIMTYFESERFGQNSDSLPPIFATESVRESNAYGSALQVHQRYAQRMAYTDSKYEGWHMLQVALERLLTRPGVLEAQTSDYLTVDFDWEAIGRDFFSTAKICTESEWVTWQDKWNRWRQKATTGTRTYAYAKESARLFGLIDTALRGIFVQQGALSIGLSAKEADSIANKNTWLSSHHGIGSEPMSTEQLKERFHLSPQFLPGGRAFYYALDGYLAYDFWSKIEEGIRRHQGLVERWRLKQILVSNDLKKVIGVVVETAEGTQRFLRTDRVYASLGYSAHYRFVGEAMPIEKIVTATGFSAFAIVLGGAPAVPVAFNSHHTTPIQESYDSIYGKVGLVKTTGGALIGSQNQYKVQHAANNIWYNGRIFGENFKAVAAQACSRSVNRGNSGKFTLFPGLVIGTGRGGKGVTDACADALIAGQLLRKNEPPYREHTIPTNGMIQEHLSFDPKNFPRP